MSINKLLPIRDAIFDAFEDMGVDITVQLPTFMRWAVRAEKEIHSYYGWKKKHKVLTIQGCVAKLPIDAMRVQYVLLGDHGCDCTDLFNCLSNYAMSVTASQNEVFLVIDKPDTESFNCCGNYYEVHDNSLIFRSNLNGQKVTIQYLGLEEDCDGFPMVGENHIEAIKQYILYRYAARSRFSPVKMEISDVQFHKMEWNRLCQEARADDAIPSEAERAAIVAMLNDPYIGWGLNVGMSTSNHWDNGIH